MRALASSISYNLGTEEGMRVAEGSGIYFLTHLTSPSGLGPSLSLWGSSCPNSGFRCIWRADPQPLATVTGYEMGLGTK